MIKHHEAGHKFLARLGKTRLRPGGRRATEWLLSHAALSADSLVLEVACNRGTTAIAVWRGMAAASSQWTKISPRWRKRAVTWQRAAWRRHDAPVAIAIGCTPSRCAA